MRQCWKHSHKRRRQKWGLSAELRRQKLSLNRLVHAKHTARMSLFDGGLHEFKSKLDFLKRHNNFIYLRYSLFVDEYSIPKRQSTSGGVYSRERVQWRLQTRAKMLQCQRTTLTSMQRMHGERYEISFAVCRLHKQNVFKGFFSRELQTFSSLSMKQLAIKFSFLKVILFSINGLCKIARAFCWSRWLAREFWYFSRWSSPGSMNLSSGPWESVIGRLRYCRLTMLKIKSICCCVRIIRVLRVLFLGLLLFLVMRLFLNTFRFSCI